MQKLKHVFLRGILFLIPIIFLGFLLVQLVKVMTTVAAAIDKLIPIDRIAGVGLTSILVVVLILLLCVVAGLISYLSFINDRVVALDRILAQSLPGYTFIRGIFGSATQAQNEIDALKPVVVANDDNSNIGFEIERTEDWVVVFVPAIPTVLSGDLLVVEAGRVTPFPMPAHQMMAAMRAHGRGLSKALGQPVNQGDAS